MYKWKILLKHKFAIQWASYNGHLKVVDKLLNDSRVDPSAGGNLAIHWASMNGHLEVVDKLLKDSCVDPSAYQNKAIQCASVNGHLEVVDRLIKYFHKKQRQMLADIGLGLKGMGIPVLVQLEIYRYLENNIPDQARLPSTAEWNVLKTAHIF